MMRPLPRADIVPHSSGAKWLQTAALILALLIFASAIAAGFVGGYLPVRLFDHDRWVSDESGETDVRLSMIDHLVRSGRLDGKSRKDVLSLLGPPTDTNYFADWHLVYRLGWQRGLFRIDSEWLVIRFGASDTVSEYEVVVD
jgi:hypothetical protein